MSESASATASAAPDAAPRQYRFGAVVPKLVYLACSLLVTALGALYLWEPLGALLLGEHVEARVAEIRVVEPGQPERVFKYRRVYPPENNLAITFQHYVAIAVGGQPVLHRISVDSRRAPIPTYNVNDKVKVAYRPGDPRHLAYVYSDARTWGFGALFGTIGLTMLVTAVPMLLATRRPVVIDPEAPSPAKAEPGPAD